MKDSIKSMIDIKHMFSTVNAVIQAKDLPIAEKSKILKDIDLEIKP